MGEGSNGTVGVLPDGTGDSRNSLLFGDLALVDGDLRELSRLLVELDRLGAERSQYRYRADVDNIGPTQRMECRHHHRSIGTSHRSGYLAR